MSQCRLITHADDFGQSHSINKGILRAHRKGIVTSASIMASGMAFDHAVKLYKQNLSLDLGIHLTLVEEYPLSKKDIIPSLISRNDRFYSSYPSFARRYLLWRINLDEVRLELEAQIRKVLEHGIDISHIDSHQHVHMLPRIYAIVIELAKRYNIPVVRIPREKVEIYMLFEKGMIPRVIQLIALNLVCALSRKNDIFSTDHFRGFFWGGVLNSVKLRKILRNLPQSGTCELMCHPGFNDCEKPNQKAGYQRRKELEALTSADTLDFIRGSNIKLITYRDLMIANR